MSKDKFIYATKSGTKMSASDIRHSIRHFENENGKDSNARIIIPEHMANKAKEIEKVFNKKVEVAPIRQDAIYISIS